jgi:hypothetical protein
VAPWKLVAESVWLQIQNPQPFWQENPSASNRFCTPEL